MKKLWPFFTSLLSEYHATKVLKHKPQERHGIFISGLSFISCVIFGGEKHTPISLWNIYYEQHLLTASEIKTFTV